MIDFHYFASIDRSRINASSFTRTTVVDVLINRVALLLIQFRRISPWKFVQHSFDRGENVGSGALLLPSVENQFNFF